MALLKYTLLVLLASARGAVIKHPEQAVQSTAATQAEIKTGLLEEEETVDADRTDVQSHDGDAYVPKFTPVTKSSGASKAATKSVTSSSKARQAATSSTKSGSVTKISSGSSGTKSVTQTTGLTKPPFATNRITPSTMTQPNKFSGQFQNTIAASRSGCEACIKQHTPAGYAGSYCLDPSTGNVDQCVSGGQCSSQEVMYEMLIKSPCVCDSWKGANIQCFPPPCFYCSYAQSLCQEQFSKSLLEVTTEEGEQVDSKESMEARSSKINAEEGMDSGLETSLTGKCG